MRTIAHALLAALAAAAVLMPASANPVHDAATPYVEWADAAAHQTYEGVAHNGCAVLCVGPPAEPVTLARQATDSSFAAADSATASLVGMADRTLAHGCAILCVGPPPASGTLRGAVATGATYAGWAMDGTEAVASSVLDHGCLVLCVGPPGPVWPAVDRVEEDARARAQWATDASQQVADAYWDHGCLVAACVGPPPV
jgi:hypothetical protein